MSQGTVSFRTGKLFAQDSKVWREVYEEDCYRLAELPVLPASPQVVDVGAHIGSFARKILDEIPRATVACVEANPRNIPLLLKNVPDAAIYSAACVYCFQNPVLFNSIIEGGTATGASRIIPGSVPPERVAGWGHRVAMDAEPVKSVTLQQIVEGHGRDIIDLLKIDAEGAEFDILAGVGKGCPSVRMIVGEYHGREHWNAFRKEHLPHWYYREISQHPRQDLGIFHAVNTRL